MFRCGQGCSSASSWSRPDGKATERAKSSIADLKIRVASAAVGVGTIFGTLVGALIIAVLSNGLILMNVSEVWQLIIKDLVIVGAVALDRYRNKGSART